MDRSICDLLDCLEYSPVKEKAAQTISVERVRELTLSRLPVTVATQYVPGAANRHRPAKRFRPAVAILVSVLLLAALCGAAYAVNLFGIRDLIMPNPITVMTYDDFPGTEDEYREIHPDGTLEDVTMHYLSLQGFAGSPEYEAMVEWTTFVDNYITENTTIYHDPDSDGPTGEDGGSEIGEDGGSGRYIPNEYTWYGVYTLEMLDKLNEILETYGLIINGEVHDYGNWYDFRESIATGQFLDESMITAFPGYIWDSGTFQFDGRHGDIWFQLRSCHKGTFDYVLAMVDDISEFSDEWVYINAHGDELLLAQSPAQSLVIAETETAFMVISLHSGPEHAAFGTRTLIDRNGLEQFADLFDIEQLR